MNDIVDKDLKHLGDLALELGVSNARVIDAKAVVVDERTRLKCQVPVCDDYGVNLMCPPNVMSVVEFAGIISKYRSVLLLQLNCHIPRDMKSMIERETGPLSNLYQNKTFITSYQKSFTRARKRLHEIVHKIESAAFEKGFIFAAGFIAGSCRLCTECVTPDSDEPCRYPFQARPSMEAMGIDVTQTAANAGLPFDTSPKDRAVFNGLILVR